MEKSLSSQGLARLFLRGVKARLALVLRWLPFSSETLGPPKGVIASTVLWIKARREKAENSPEVCWTVIEPYQIRRTLPKMIGQQTLENFHPMIEQTYPAVQAMQLTGARVLYLNVISPTDHIFLDLSSHRDVQREELQWLLSSLKLPDVKRVKGNLALIGESFGGTYYHWLFFALGRLAYIRKQFPLEKIAYFSVSHLQKSFQRDSLRMLGIDHDRILPLEKFPHVKPDAMVTAEWPASFDPTVAAFLREAFLPHGATPSHKPLKRIYVSRAQCGRRHIVNESEFLETIQRWGFQKVFCEGLSFAEQIALFRDAEAIIGPHGAGLANLAFCRPATKVIELHNEGWRSELFWKLSEFMGLDYYALLGEDQVTPGNTARSQDSNFSVDLSQVVELLTKAGLSPEN